MTAPLLTPEDPAPFELLCPQGHSPYFFTCEHAGKRFPKTLGTLGLSGDDLERHITWDIGAATLARHLSHAFEATCVLQTYSRLVVDCNRWTSAADYITTLSEETAIPGNMDLTQAQIDIRTCEIYKPYHDTISTLLDARQKHARPTVVVAVHSCTPVYLGVHRPWHIGVLYEHDQRFADILLDILRTNDDLVVGDNEPYFMTDKKDYSMPVHGQQRGLPHVEFEIRQDLIGDEAGQYEWGERLNVWSSYFPKDSSACAPRELSDV